MNNTEKLEKEQIEKKYLEILSTLEVINFILKDPNDVHSDIELAYGLKAIVSSIVEDIDYELVSKLKY